MSFTVPAYCRFAVPCTLTLAILCIAPVWAGFEEGMPA